jgi:thiamine-monophosphate kinase
MASLEFDRIRWLDGITRRISPGGSCGRVHLAIGDDAALWTPPAGCAAVLTVDVQVEGIHFRSGWLRPEEIGARAVAASASDLAAMAARPGGILLALTIPRGTPESTFRALYRGALEEARRSGLEVLGGNLSSGPLQLSVTAVGAVRPGEAVARGGARPGDGIYVTGWPGRSRIGRGVLEAPAAGRPGERACLRAFKAPRARIREALWIAGRFRPRAMVDISDGLALDLSHILEMSPSLGKRPGAVLDLPAIGALLEDGGAGGLARSLGLNPIEAALTGGEDYELLFAAASGPAGRAAAGFRRRFGIPLTRVGTVVKDPGIRSSDGGKIRAGGFDHFGETKEPQITQMSADYGRKDIAP